LLGDGRKCPLCDKEWQPERLKAHLKVRIEKGKQAQKYQSGLQSSAGHLASIVNNLLPTVLDLATAAQRLGMEDLHGQLTAWAASLANLRAQTSNSSNYRRI